MEFLRKIRKYPLRNSIFVTNFFTSVISTVLLCVFIYYLSDYLYTSSLKKEMEIASQDLSEKIEQYFSSLNNTSHGVFYNTIFTEMIEQPAEEEYWLSANRIKRYLSSCISYSNMCLAVGFYDMDGNYYVSNENAMYVSQEMINSLVDQNQFQKGKLCYLDSIVKNTQGYYAGVAVRKVRAGAEPTSELKEIGTGIMYINLNELLNSMTVGNIAEQAAIMVYDREGKLIVQQKAQPELIEVAKTINTGSGLTEFSIGHTDYIAFCKEIPNIQWRIVTARSDQEVAEMMRFLRLGLILFCAAIMIFLLFWMYKISTRITFPIQKLAEGMSRMAKDHMKTRIELPYKNEIAYLAEQFNEMNEEVRKLTQEIITTQSKLYEVEVAKGNLELLGLQTQINSHFLFNTLYYIRSRALIGEKEQVSRVMQYLCGFLRYAVEARRFVELKQEIESAKLYLKILNERWNGRINCKIEMEPELEQVEVLRMILQPLVENSILHGYDKDICPGIMIKIACHREGEHLLIKVMDTGIGISQQQVEAMNEVLQRPVELVANENMERNKTLGIGVKNINRRLKIYYGNTFGLTVKSFEGIGTIFKIRIPLEMNRESRENV